MEKIELKVEGMTCGGCAKSIKNALATRPGIGNTDADVPGKLVTVEFDPAQIQRDGIVAAIEAAGFDVAA